MPRRAARKDTNHNAIAAVFEREGWSVADTSVMGDGFPDMVIAKDGVTVMIEAKSQGGTITGPQQDFMRDWQGRVYVCRSELEALAIIQELGPQIKGAGK